MKRNSILALDIGAGSIKMAEFSALRSGGLELINFGIAPLGLDPAQEADRPAYVVNTIREVMQQHNIQPGSVLVSVAGQSVFSRFVKLPPVDTAKVYQIILYEAQQNVPFPMEEVVWDYQLIAGQDGAIDVMLAAIKSEIVEDLTDCVQSTGLEPMLVDVAPMTLFNTVRYNYDQLGGCTLLVDMGARSTDLIFIEAGRFFNRSIPVAGNAITQQIMREFDMDYAAAEELKKAHAFVSFGGAYEAPTSEVADKVSKSVRMIMTRVHAEIDRSINFYRSQQGGARPSLVLLTGGTSVIPHIDTFLKSKLKIDVDYLNPFQNVAVSSAIPAEEIGGRAHLLGETVGLALRHILACPIEINLLPPKVTKARAMQRKIPYFIWAAFAVVAIVLLWGLFFLKTTGLADSQLARAKSEVMALDAFAAQLQGIGGEEQKVVAQADELAAINRKRAEWLRILDTLHAAVPPGMWITAVTPLITRATNTTGEVNAETGEPVPGPLTIAQVDVAGMGYVDVVKNAQPISDFRDKLRAAELFADESDIVSQPSPAPDAYTREFQLRLLLSQPIML